MLGKIIYIGLLAGAVILIHLLGRWADKRRESYKGFSKKFIKDLENRYYEKI
jgi:hypothetical protein